ncbi:hypothetical protein BDP27DRAFT_317625 [Rhodocollybia butyracea]|uniref:Uncharacterized protein n=1 Tax=Rhodocollybia butyracea TaxID=206335 RepID=A0A9P5Q1C5_9AGAR|nr:hypothetical protein BDP27DRAFT_317625 [Rhodocollybia butyracea]
MPRSAPSPPSFSEKYVSRAEYDELKSRFEHLETVVHRFITTKSGTITEPGSLGSATGHPPSGSRSPGGLLSSQASAGPDYLNQGSSTAPSGYGVTGTLGDETPPAGLPSFTSQGVAHLNPSIRHPSNPALSKTSPHLMPPPNYSQQHRSIPLDDSASPTHHYQQVPQGPSGFASTSAPSHLSRTHKRKNSRSSVGSAGSHGSASTHSPVLSHAASGMAVAGSPVLQYRSMPHETSASSVAKNSPLSLASITSPFDVESMNRASGMPMEVPPSHSTPPFPPTSSPDASPIVSQSKNFHAQTLRLGERLRLLPSATSFLRKPCTLLLIIRMLLMPLILLTQLTRIPLFLAPPSNAA